MVANILEYKSVNLILYCCSGLLDTIRVVIWNFIRLMRNIWFGLWVDR